MSFHCHLSAVAPALLTPTELLRFRLASYFERYPVQDIDDMVGSYGVRVHANWAVDLILRGDEPAPYDIDLDCSRRHISSATVFRDSVYCITCGHYHINLPVAIAQPTIHRCVNCKEWPEGTHTHTLYYDSANVVYNPCRY